jgi:hypothetical protein
MTGMALTPRPCPPTGSQDFDTRNPTYGPDEIEHTLTRDRPSGVVTERGHRPRWAAGRGCSGDSGHLDADN